MFLATALFGYQSLFNLR